MSTADATASRLSFHTHALLASACGVAYFYAFQLNQYWFNDWLEFSHGANWIFIPSGLRLLFVLVLGATGASGITLSSIAINYTLGDQDAHLFNIVTGLISGGAPYLARHLCVKFFGLDTQLVNLSNRGFFKISVLFAIVNALLHQTWFYYMGKTPNFFASAIAMAVGDWLGTVLVLAGASLAIRLLKLRSGL